MKFDITKKLDLSYIDGWEGCYLEFAMPSYKDVKGFADNPEDIEKGLETISELFRAGKGISRGKTVDIAKSDIKELPLEIINKAMALIAGQVDPKENGNSMTA
jgi:hypothetical protein